MQAYDRAPDEYKGGKWEQGRPQSKVGKRKEVDTYKHVNHAATTSLYFESHSTNDSLAERGYDDGADPLNPEIHPKDHHGKAGLGGGQGLPGIGMERVKLWNP